MNDIAFKVIIKNDGIDDVIFKTIMLKGEKGDKGDAGETEIDDSTTSATKTWSSQKIDSMIAQTETIEDVAIASFSDGADDVPVSELTVEIEAVQDLHGYDKPWVGGAGKNKLNLDVLPSSEVTYGVTVQINNGIVTLNGTVSATEFLFPRDESSTGIPNQEIYKNLEPSTNYILSVGNSSNNIGIQFFYRETATSGWNLSAQSWGTGILQFRTPETFAVVWIRIRYARGTVFNNLKLYPMIRLASEPDATFEPYSNICPITGHDSGVITVTDNDQVTNTYTFAFGQTVYGGHFDNKGNLEVNKIKIHIDSSYTFSSELEYVYTNCNNLIKALNYTDKIICDKLITSSEQYGMPIGSISGYADKNNLYPNQNWLYFRVAETTTLQIMKDWLDSVGGIDVVYELATPIPLSITSKDVRTLLGNNNIFADTGNINKLVYFKTGSEAVARMIEAYMRASN